MTATTQPLSPRRAKKPRFHVAGDNGRRTLRAAIVHRTLQNSSALALIGPGTYLALIWHLSLILIAISVWYSHGCGKRSSYP